MDAVFDVNFNFDHKYSAESLKASLNNLNEKIERSKMPPKNRTAWNSGVKLQQP